ncbi:MAG: Arc family DNA-binding protein [Hyphomicrobiales bacterium]|nr:MAG: Arc family DNA-binding protein [Hyphomicrobiales bacterium]
MPIERKPQAADKYIVRFPDGMREQIAATAKANNRTMNAEIVARLDQTFAPIAEDPNESALQRKRAEAKKTQIEQAQVGLTFIHMAIQFLEAECPDVLKSKSRALLKQSIAATEAALPQTHPRSLAETLRYLADSQAKCLALFTDLRALEFPDHVSNEEIAELAEDAHAALEKMSRAMERANRRRAASDKT